MPKQNRALDDAGNSENAIYRNLIVPKIYGNNYLEATIPIQGLTPIQTDI